MALIPPENQQRVTHFVEDVELPADAVGIHLATYHHKDPNSIAELALPFVYVPTAARRSHFRKRAKVDAPQSHPSALTHFGITMDSLAPEEAAAVKLDATQVQTPFQVAETILFNHPELMTLRQDVAANVLYNHIDQALNQDDTLPQYLSANGPGTQDPYYAIVAATNPQTGAPINPISEDENGNPIVDKNGNPLRWPQQNGQNVIQRYKLSAGVVGTDDGTQQGNAASALAVELQTTKDDHSLNGQLWSAQHGITSIQHSIVEPAAPAPAMKAAPEAVSRIESSARPLSSLCRRRRISRSWTRLMGRPFRLMS